MARTRSIARLANFGAVLLLSVVAAFLVIQAVIRRGSADDDVTVPSLVGMDQSGAIVAIEAAGLRARVGATVGDTIIRTGRVAAQEPGAGVRIRKGALVTLSPSSGPAYTIVPDVLGQDIASARAAISQAGLVPGAIDTMRDTTMAGRIAATMPPAGSQLHPGAQVALSVSAGTASIAVPDLIGLAATEARTRLDSAGLRVGRIRAASEGRAGHVQGQRPIAGTLVTSGTEVELTVSEGSR